MWRSPSLSFFILPASTSVTFRMCNLVQHQQCLWAETFWKCIIISQAREAGRQCRWRLWQQAFHPTFKCNYWHTGVDGTSYELGLFWLYWNLKSVRNYMRSHLGITLCLPQGNKETAEKCQWNLKLQLHFSQFNQKNSAFWDDKNWDYRNTKLSVKWFGCDIVIRFHKNIYSL